MTEKGQIYRCDICENIVTVLSEGEGELVCCKVPMQLLKEKHSEDGFVKHVPLVEKHDGVVKVNVGEVPHPMEENHYIEWVELTIGNKVFIEFLKPGNIPEAEFPVVTDSDIMVRSYCNIHGLWKS